MTDHNETPIAAEPHREKRAMHPRAERTRAAIVDGAARHFDTTGYAESSLNTIITGTDFTITKGSVYFHFPSKEAIAQQLVRDWINAVQQAISAAISTGIPAAEQLAVVFNSLARQITDDTNLRAGMKLTIEASVDNAGGFAHWVDAISDIVETAITAGDIADTPIAHRLAWNLCAGTVGAAYAAQALREDVDLATRIDDAVAEHLRSALAPA
ncbi:TetR family transcriptional regulator [Rhodococcus sp. SRB_17]|nr:TetR family transcriptional regulator [Rhodococcus sp. SRB_17]